MNSKINKQEDCQLSKEDLFAHKVFNVLGHNPEVSDHISTRLMLSRQEAVKRIKLEKQISFGSKLLQAFKEKLAAQIATGITATATVCFAVVVLFSMDAENQMVFDQNIQEISLYSEQTDLFDFDFDFEESEEEVTI